MICMNSSCLSRYGVRLCSAAWTVSNTVEFYFVWHTIFVNCVCVGLFVFNAERTSTVQ